MRSVDVALGERSYSITIGPGVANSLRACLQVSPSASPVVVLADQTVANLHLAALTASLPPNSAVLPFAPGETAKSLTMVEHLCERLAALHAGRQTVILAFGGGVAGDLAGFVAAVYLRGVRFIQVPTTLLAAVDAAVGGKTGVNLAAGKNLVGAFYQPLAVVIDTDFLKTLSKRDCAAGLAESVKHAAVRDPALLTWHADHADAILARDSDNFTELIARNCAIKADVVARDERETGLRAILNHGHTIAHALEHLLNYELRHGECVALGMQVENELSCTRGWLPRPDAERIQSLLQRFDLPTHLPRRLAPADIWTACQMDKKNRGAAVNFVLLRGLADPVRVADVTAAEVERALEIIQPP
jgi:3-dehydroquinate synthase